MCTETLQATKQPDEPPHVEPCHTGKAAKVCSFDIALLEQALDAGPGAAITCISCGVLLGSAHLSTCAFQTFRDAS